MTIPSEVISRCARPVASQPAAAKAAEPSKKEAAFDAIYCYASSTEKRPAVELPPEKKIDVYAEPDKYLICGFKFNGPAEMIESWEPPDTSVSLTQSQRDYLSARYNPKQMSEEAYDAFLEDLIEFGVLEKKDKLFVRGGKLIPVHWTTRSAFASLPEGYGRFGIGYNTSGGDALNWAYYGSEFRFINPITDAREKTKSAALFTKVYNVLSQI